jgi:hypothetical protein
MDEALEGLLDDFWLEPDSHVYTLNGGVVPACTETLSIVRPSLDDIPRKVLKRATDRGKDVHKAVELRSKNDYDARTGSMEIKARMKQWEWFLREYRVRLIPVDVSLIRQPMLRALFDASRLLVEIPLVHPIYKFGVTADVALAEIMGRIGLIEVKATSTHNKATALQTAAQKETINYVFRGVIPPIEVRYGVRLTGVGKPDVRLYDDETNWMTYLSVLNTYNFIQLP